ncbi:MAG: glutamate formimidoyltransferase [Gemmatimonadetes bacterium]|nr:glutamate formimidoyltransferase [Gemmatimonadota bacterium]
MTPVLEAVPNFSEGRDVGVVRRIAAAAASAGAEVLDWSADPDHHRAVVTFVGDPRAVEQGAVAAALVAREAIDLRRHEGVHPRIGALDVLPFVPLLGLTLDEAVASAHRVGAQLAEAGIPVYFYGAASRPPGRQLADLRRGGFESLVGGFPNGRRPDLLPPDWTYPGIHPRWGAACVGARKLLLAWNVYVDGVSLAAAKSMAAGLREANSGFVGLRALALQLPSTGAIQISMNLEDPDATSPDAVFEAILCRVSELGGQVQRTEVVGMIPDALVLSTARSRLHLSDPSSDRLLSHRLALHLGRRAEAAVREVLEAVFAEGEAVPPAVREAAQRSARDLAGLRTVEDERR